MPGDKNHPLWENGNDNVWDDDDHDVGQHNAATGDLDTAEELPFGSNGQPSKADKPRFDDDDEYGDDDDLRRRRARQREEAKARDRRRRNKFGDKSHHDD